jgi:hypothetical protein
MDSHFWDIVRDIRSLIQVSQRLRPLLSHLADPGRVRTDDLFHDRVESA